ncbi:hypothetical protein RB195_015077 [Necator americanus]|uniref:Transposase n=1 Tax=Necator americanus TaxID=51031 RepID=A0ABR1E311_NECAM
MLFALLRKSMSSVRKSASLGFIAATVDQGKQYVVYESLDKRVFLRHFEIMRLKFNSFVFIMGFKAGNKELEDETRSGRPTATSFDELKNLAEQHPYEGVRYFAASLGCSLSTVSNRLRSLGMVKKLGRWLPNALSDGNRQRRLDFYTQLLSRSFRFDCFELLPDNATVTAEVYCAQLQRLADKIPKEHSKFDNVRVLRDNARYHIAKKAYQEILELGWKFYRTHRTASPGREALR